MRRIVDNLFMPLLMGWLLIKIVLDYGWWSLAVIPAIYIVGIVAFQIILWLYGLHERPWERRAPR